MPLKQATDALKLAFDKYKETLKLYGNYVARRSVTQRRGEAVGRQ